VAVETFDFNENRPRISEPKCIQKAETAEEINQIALTPPFPHGLDQACDGAACTRNRRAASWICRVAMGISLPHGATGAIRDCGRWGLFPGAVPHNEVTIQCKGISIHKLSKSALQTGGKCGEPKAIPLSSHCWM